MSYCIVVYNIVDNVIADDNINHVVVLYYRLLYKMLTMILDYSICMMYYNYVILMIHVYYKCHVVMLCHTYVISCSRRLWSWSRG